MSFMFTLRYTVYDLQHPPPYTRLQNRASRGCPLPQPLARLRARGATTTLRGEGLPFPCTRGKGLGIEGGHCNSLTCGRGTCQTSVFCFPSPAGEGPGVRARRTAFMSLLRCGQALKHRAENSLYYVHICLHCSSASTTAFEVLAVFSPVL